MKKVCLSLVFLIYALSSGGQTAIELLEKMNNKCLEIQNGKYTLERKFKFLSHTDTNFKAGTVVFERFPQDSLFGFKMWLENATDSVTKYYDGTYVYTVLPHKNSVTIDTLRQDNFSAIRGSAVGPLMAFPLISRKPINALTDSDAMISFDPASTMDTTVILIKYPDGRMGGKLNNNWLRWFIDAKTSLPVAKEEYLEYDKEVQYEYFKVTSVSVNVTENVNWLNGPKWTQEYDTFYQQLRVRTKPLNKDTIAPAWEGIDFTGDSIRFPGIKARLYMVDFWYKGCHPCVMAMPFLQRMHENYSAQGLKVIGLNPFDYKQKDSEMFKAFLKRRNLSYTLAFINNDVTKNYKVQAYPTLYLITGDGVVIHSQVGYSETVDAGIEKIIKEYLEKK